MSPEPVTGTDYDQQHGPNWTDTLSEMRIAAVAPKLAAKRSKSSRPTTRTDQQLATKLAAIWRPNYPPETRLASAVSAASVIGAKPGSSKRVALPCRTCPSRASRRIHPAQPVWGRARQFSLRDTGRGRVRTPGRAGEVVGHADLQTAPDRERAAIPSPSVGVRGAKTYRALGRKPVAAVGQRSHREVACVHRNPARVVYMGSFEPQRAADAGVEQA